MVNRALNFFSACDRTRIIALAIFISINLVSAADASSWPKAPTVDAKSWAMIDARSGQIIAEHNADQELPPASLTKMMTLYLAFEDIRDRRLNLQDRVSVSRKAWKIGGSTMFLDPRMHPTVEELLHGIATLSGNDACIALAEFIEGSEEAFAERMTVKARELGMTRTYFMNATGFPAEGHYSTAMDMALLGVALWHEFPELYKLFGEKEYSFDNRTQPNRNRLLWSYPDADGIKTGHTKAAGYCLVGSAERDNTRFVAAVFGAGSERSRARYVGKLMNFGFRKFVTLRPAEKEIRRKVEVFSGAENHVWLKPLSPIWVTIPKGSESSLSFRLRYEAPLKAAIKKDQVLGSIDAVFGKGKRDINILKSIPMVAARDVDRASWFGRQWDALRLWWRTSTAE